MSCQCNRGTVVSGGTCRSCLAQRLGRATRKHFWTPALRTSLRLAYAMKKRERSEAITELQMKTGWPRHAFKLEAQRLGIVGACRRQWAPAEDQAIAEMLDTATVKQIARKLGRSYASVKARSERLRLSVGIAASGYRVQDLAQIFGVPRYKVEEWIEMGLFDEAIQPDREPLIEVESVRRFVRKNLRLIDFRLADQAFLKGVLAR